MYSNNKPVKFQLGIKSKQLTYCTWITCNLFVNVNHNTKRKLVLLNHLGCTKEVYYLFNFISVAINRGIIPANFVFVCFDGSGLSEKQSLPDTQLTIRKQLTWHKWYSLSEHRSVSTDRRIMSWQLYRYWLDTHNEIVKQNLWMKMFVFVWTFSLGWFFLFNTEFGGYRSVN